MDITLQQTIKANNNNKALGMSVGKIRDRTKGGEAEREREK